MQVNLLNYLLQLADNALILGHRLSEWCAHGPILEQDIALTNTALDHIGQARNLYQYAAEIFNTLSAEEKQLVFTSIIPMNGDATEDTLAYLRDGWDFKNCLLVEQPNVDWAYTIIRSFLYDGYAVLLYSNLKNSKDERLAAIAEKSLKEALYHRKWSSEWVIRLGDGTDESHERITNALNDRWEFSGELFTPSESEQSLIEKGIAADPALFKEEWTKHILDILEQATLSAPNEKQVMQQGGKTGIHSEHLGFVLAEMQFMQRTYPGMEW